jgi:amino-acid N-acetyltransferase
MRARKATLPDAEAVCAMIASYSADGTVLPRSLGEVCENIRDFTVVEDKGRIIGCAALHLYGPHLAEVRSITVAREAQGRGAGHRLVRALITEAGRHSVRSICLFTRIPDYFTVFGFSVVNRDDLPDKLLKDCLACPRLHCCDETAMILGELPEGTARVVRPADLIQLQ